MIFIIHYEVNGHEDQFSIEENDIEEIREYVKYELDRRGATYLYSEEI